MKTQHVDKQSILNKLRKAKLTEFKEGDASRFQGAIHLWSENERMAAVAAVAAGRPLLVRGEPGTGKSQLARAIACEIGATFLDEVVNASFETTDSLYKPDMIRRLADAESKKELKDWQEYLDKGIFWRAADQSLATEGDTLRPCVVLIDEIDKAESDVPNAMLDVLANASFKVPYPPTNPKVINLNRENLPICIFTTNEDRELPAAFIRRCVVLNLNPPSDESCFKDWLVARGEKHFPELKQKILEQAAAMIWSDRESALENYYPPVGLAEYIDLLRALCEVGGKPEEWLKQLAPYFLVKHKDGIQGPQDGKRSKNLEEA